MKASFFSLVLLGFFLSVTAQFAVPDRKKFYPLKDTCPTRPWKIFATLSSNNSPYSNYASYIHSALLKEGSFQTDGWLGELRDQGVIFSYEGHYSIDSDGFIDVTALNAELILIQQNFASHQTRGVEVDMFVIFFRHELVTSRLYNLEFNVLKSMGVKVITVDFYNTRQAAIASGTASLPFEKNVFHYPERSMIDLNLIIQSARNDNGHVCVVSGRTNIQTYDGLIYQHDEIGDFVLARQLPGTESGSFSLEVQIRKSQCDDSAKREACITGVGVRRITTSTEDLSIQYDRDANDVIITEQGVVYESQRYSNSLLSITRIEPEIGLRVVVQASLNVPLVTMEFYRDEKTQPVILIHGTSNAWVMTTGMCGTFDSCELNDFITPEGNFTEENATYTNEWRVHGAASIFEWKQYSSDSTSSKVLSLRQPIYSVGWTSRAKKHDLGEPELSDEAIYILCEQACAQGISASALVNQLGVKDVCSDYCDEISSDLTGLRTFDLHGNYTEKPPAVNIATMNSGRKATARIPMEGTYVFGVSTYDCCNNSEPVNVTLEVKCSRRFDAEAGENISVELGPFPVPYIRLDGSLKKSGSSPENIHVSWIVVEYPGKDMENPPPKIIHPFSLTPTLVPKGVGNYILELSAFDGCRLSKDTVQVEVKCVEIEYQKQSGLHHIVWTPQGGTQSAFSDLSLGYSTKCPTANLRVMPSVEAQLSWGKPMDTNFQIHKTSTNSFVVGYWKTINITSPGNETFTDPTSSYHEDPTPIPVPQKDGIIRNEVRHREVIMINNSITRTTVSYRELGTVHMEQCDLRYDTSSYDDSVSMLWRVAPRTTPTKVTVPSWAESDAIVIQIAEKMKHGIGICPGIYKVDTTVMSEVACNNFTHNYNLDVHCGAKWTGPLAKPLSPCLPVKFNYDNHQFPPALLPSDSSDRWNRYLSIKKWEMKTHPDPSFEWTRNYTDPSQAWTMTSNSLSSKIPGKYTLEHQVSNGCAHDSEIIELAFECTGDVFLNMTNPGTTLTYNYTSMTNQLVFTPHPYSTAKTSADQPAPAIILGYVLTQPNNEETFISSSLPFVLTPQYFRTLGVSTLTVSPLVSDYCRTKREAFVVTLSCPNSFTITPDVANRTNIPVYPSRTSAIATSFSSGLLYSFTHTSPYAFTSTIWSFGVPGNRSTDYSTADPNSVTLDFPPGLYNAYVTVDDGCKTASAQLEFTLKCAPHKWNLNLTSSHNTMFVDANTTLISVSASNSVFVVAGLPGTYYAQEVWELTQPNGQILTQRRTISRYSTLSTFQFTPTIAGTYTAKITIDDGCNINTASYSITAICLYSLTAQASQPQDVTWSKNKFPIISVDGKPSTWTGPVKPTYDWEVLEAPTGSLFEGRLNVHTQEQIYNDTQMTSTVSYSDNNFYSILETYTAVIRTEIESRWFITSLLNDPGAGDFGACFRPDLPGKYTLKLTLQTSLCNVKTTTINVNANCNGKPSVVANVPATSFYDEPIILDASGSSDPDNDDLSFQWKVFDCETQTAYTDYLVNSASSKAFFIPDMFHSIQAYCFTLNVTDGCNTPIDKSWRVELTCKNESHSIEEQSIKAKFNGLDLQDVDMEIPANENVNDSWFDTHVYTWTLLNFEHDQVKHSALTDGKIAGIVVGVVAGVALIAGIVAAIVLGVTASKGSS